MVTLQGRAQRTPDPTTWSLGYPYDPDKDTGPTMYAFDVFLRLNHQSSITTTQHPVQTGAAITDHSYVNPQKFSCDIGVSDVARPIILPGITPIRAQPTRYKRAYDVLKEMQRSRKPLQLISKYGVFNNILIELIDIPDDATTQNAIKATLNLTEILLVDVKAIQVSGLPQTTDYTDRGPVAGQPINDSWIYRHYGVVFPSGKP